MEGDQAAPDAGDTQPLHAAQHLGTQQHLQAEGQCLPGMQTLMPMTHGETAGLPSSTVYSLKHKDITWRNQRSGSKSADLLKAGKHALRF